MKNTILILSKYDSFARMAKCVADAFAARGFNVDYRLIAAGREALSRRVYHELGLSETTPVTSMKRLFQSGELAGFTAVYLGATGGFIRNFLLNMQSRFPQGTPRPLTITGYPGIILREKLSGFANRCGCDVVLLNSPADLQEYRRFCAHYGITCDGARLFGYAFPPVQLERKERLQRVLFVEQSAIPASLRERLYLIHQLAAYASRHPDREIIIKPRLVPGEKSLFTTKYHLEFLIQSLPDVPKNMRVDYGDIQQLLQTADLCLTISSSVALQSMWYGIPTGIIRDFGIRDEYGTDFFRESGCLCSFEDLMTDKLPRLNREWFTQNFAYYDKTRNFLPDSIAEEYRRREQLHDWKYTPNLHAVFSDAYLHFRRGKSLAGNTLRTLFSTCRGWLISSFRAFFQSLL